ncbi:Peptidase C48, SUMO/Sentrin/Ubl1 [Artemisia annua]|uniref:Peptidase C48, SUMO/Sentrin/Ubl1 n=1 Tax=Artemisia annua TaxID=35608 RepID=A0A2U1QH87_ARTAN|nr:Peptidase C48, SUMO/Sentrin/Ubl1 [Artemisia annua]
MFSYEPLDEQTLDEIFEQTERATQTKERKTKSAARKSVTPPEKMMTTRSKMKSISPPSFSLGISTLSSKPAAQTDTTTVEVTPQVEKKAAVETDTTTSEPKPKMEKRARKMVAEKENKEQEPPAKRIKKPSRYLVSPYNNRKTALKAPQTPDESMVSEALFSMQGDPYEFVFETEWAWGAATIRDNMQTLAPQLKVDVSIIDSFACILNYEETINKPVAPKINQFFHTGILAFFPIIAQEHFYLVVFNISKGTSVIIDNSPKAYDAKYKKECDVLVSLRLGHRRRMRLSLSALHMR